MRVCFSTRAWPEYLHWQEADRTVLIKLNTLIEQCRRTPFAGLGKLEPLKGSLAGWWSRRLTEEDRLVYRVAGRRGDQELAVSQCRSHY